MLHKVWHKPAHKRKYWKQKSIFEKMGYYMKPFVIEILDIILEPLPFPTIFKIVYSSVMLLMTLVPLIIPILILLWTYIDVQILLSSFFGIIFQSQYDLFSYSMNVISFKVPCAAHNLYVNMYFERFKVGGLTIISVIDYVRVAFYICFGERD